MAVLLALHILSVFRGGSFGSSPLILLLVAPYVAIALGAGWFGEVRRSAADLRATQLQLIQSEKLESMGRLAAGVAHEVKNPLMTILTGVKVLSKRMADADEPTRQLLQDMTDAVNRADTIIGGLLSYSRPRGLHAALVDLNETLERSLLLMKHDLEKRRIAVIRDFTDALPWLELDEFKIEQVFIDLFTNALQAMGDEGVLTLRTRRITLGRQRTGQGGADQFRPGEAIALVEIEDTGPGIPAHYLGKVFDPFFTTKPVGAGTGLGLSVARQIVEMHGGTIDIANNDAKGARVTMKFKLERTRSHT
jgi:signal transduction histidine kinase